MREDCRAVDDKRKGQCRAHKQELQVTTFGINNATVLLHVSQSDRLAWESRDRRQVHSVEGGSESAAPMTRRPAPSAGNQLWRRDRPKTRPICPTVDDTKLSSGSAISSRLRQTQSITTGARSPVGRRLARADTRRRAPAKTCMHVCPMRV